MVLVMIGSCVAVPSAGSAPESEVTSSSATIYVPDGYSTIQAAVDAATPEDTIIVRDGTYLGGINVYKRLTIQSENGTDSTIVLGSPGGNGFEVITNYVTISGFIIEGASFSCGILISGVNNCNISNNIVSGNLQGIYLSKSSRNMIFNNTAFSNENCGIVLNDSSTQNQIIKNNVSNNLNYQGILLLSSSENIIANNTAKNNGENGIYLEESNSNRITGNDASNNVNYNGISLDSSTDNEISNNIANSNHYHGIGLFTSSENIIANNTAKNNGNNGVFLKMG
jgi:parallel beta-helix repeat protein